ncbi:hypothetical protein GO009_02645 [Muricauda sp. TY007]|uniref:HipA family kinase n=1 Tax=Allomuricauda sp. TY007 TaxID=2683200 RepID=UPI0013BEFB18|nr:HipA family kinase [Muricauda sp. TY007]NDV14912.1 hypothetical protein [Muricauda sp. TY007]
MLEPISVINAISVDREIYTDGHSPLLTIGEDYEKYVVKNSKGRIPAFDLVNEFLANGLLQCWKIPTPGCAILKIDSSLVVGYSNNHQARFYNYSSFGSRVLPKKLDLNEFTVAKNKSVFNKLCNPIDILRIGLFDLWVSNDDRKPTNQNLILSIDDGGKYTITAIDHAFIFETLPYQDLNPKHFSPSINDHIILSDLAKIVKRYTNIDESFVKSEREYFYFCLEESLKNFEKIINNIPIDLGLNNDLTNFLSQFLFNQERNEKVFAEHIYRLSN